MFYDILWWLMAIYDVLWPFMSKEQSDGNCHIMSQLVVKCSNLSRRLSQIVVTFVSAVPFPLSFFGFAESSQRHNLLLARLILGQALFGVSQKGSRERCLLFLFFFWKWNGRNGKKTEEKGKKTEKIGTRKNSQKGKKGKQKKTEENGRKRKKTEAAPFRRPLLRNPWFQFACLRP